MIVFPEDNTAWFDIDDTLAMWSPTKEQKDQYGIEVTCPASVIYDSDGSVIGSSPEWKEKLVPHRVHIEQIKKHKMRGHKIILWSQGGATWAKAVAEAFGLVDFVDLVIGKPTWIYDDKDPSFWMPKPYWLEDK